jgi:hypothetical protein
MIDERPKYTKDEEEDETYKEDFFSPGGMRLEDLEEPPEKVVEKVIVKQKQAIPREDEDVTTVKRTDSDIIGSIFDRVNFIEQRITDIRENIDIRKGLNESMLIEIDEDIKDKRTMLGQAVDMDERRNIMLDISLLRREKRNEQVRFWKDMYELNAELRELMERLEVESKIVSMFDSINPVKQADKATPKKEPEKKEPAKKKK